MLRRLSGRRPDPLERVRAALAAQPVDWKNVTSALDDVVRQLKTVAGNPAAAKQVPDDVAALQQALVGAGVPLLLPALEKDKVAWSVVELLAHVPGACSVIIETPGFVDTAVNCLSPPVDRNLANSCMDALRAISSLLAVRITLASTPALADRLRDLIGIHETANAALKLVTSLAYTDSNHLATYLTAQCPGLVAAVSARISVEGFEVIALRALHNLGLHPPNLLIIARDTELLKLVVGQQLEKHPRPAVILVSLLADTPETHPGLLAVDVVDKLDNMPVPTDDDGYVSMRRLLALANVLGPDRERLRRSKAVSSDAILKVRSLLDKVLGPETGGWPLAVPLRAIASLTLSEELRAKLGADLPTKALLAMGLALTKRDPDACALACGVLSNFCYTDAEREALGAIAELRPMLDRVLAENAPEWSRAVLEAKGLAWTLSSVAATPTTTTLMTSPRAASKLSTMISYCWAQQPFARALAEALRNAGFDVWIDVESMNADVMQAMASAVLSSQVVFCLVSTGYVHSANCRREATFAAERKKRIIPLIVEPGVNLDTWLGILIAGLLRYSISSPETVQREIADVLRKEELDNPGAVGSFGREAAGGAGKKKNAHPAGDVSQWLASKNCAALEAPLRDCDALDWDTLRSLWRRKPSVAELKSVLGIKSVRLVCLLLDELDEVFS